MEKRILIYDDDLEILHVIRLILNKNEYFIESRTRCDDIIKDVSDIQPDVIIMDIRIPEIGGQKAITLIKHHEFLNTVPVIILSASSQIEALSKMVNADAFLKKPFDIKELETVVEELINGTPVFN